MDAIALLKADHEKMKGLLNELEATTERGVKTRTELFATIKGELTLHEIIEEEIFYPELKAHPKAKDIVLEAYEEHHVVDLLMGELEALDGCLSDVLRGRTDLRGAGIGHDRPSMGSARDVAPVQSVVGRCNSRVRCVSSDFCERELGPESGRLHEARRLPSSS